MQVRSDQDTSSSVCSRCLGGEGSGARSRLPYIGQTLAVDQLCLCRTSKCTAWAKSPNVVMRTVEVYLSPDIGLDENAGDGSRLMFLVRRTDQ